MILIQQKNLAKYSGYMIRIVLWVHQTLIQIKNCKNNLKKIIRCCGQLNKDLLLKDLAKFKANN